MIASPHPLLRAWRDEDLAALQAMHADPEVVSMTAASNLRSRAVMDRLGFSRDPARDFEHPFLAQSHPLRQHVFYFIRSGK